MVQWRRSLAYPFRGPERERPVVATWVLFLVGTIVPILPVVPVVGWLVPIGAGVAILGYLLRVLAASERGDPAPALLDRPLELVRSGLGGLLVTAVYLVVPFLLLLLSIYGAIYTDRVPDPNSFDAVTIYAGSTAVLALSLLGAYLLPIALSNYVGSGSLRTAFTRRDFRRVGINGAYFAGWTLAFVGLLSTIGLAAGIASLHRGGPVITTAILAYGSILSVFVWGRSLARARGRR